MRADFVLCFVAKIVGKEIPSICDNDVLMLREKLRKQENLLCQIYSEMNERNLFLDKEEHYVLNYYEIMSQCLEHWGIPNYEEYVRQHFKSVKRNELIYWASILKKTGLYYGNAYDLFMDFLKSINNDYKPKDCENGESAILYYVLKFNKSFGIWEALLAGWNKNKKRYLGEEVKEGNEDKSDGDESKILYLNFAGRPSELNYNTLKEFVDIGLSNVDQKTEKSIREIKKSISELTDKGNETNIVKIFGDDLLEHIGNCQKRRKWYMFRLMEQIIKRQMKEFVNLVTEYQKKAKEFYELWEDECEDITDYYAQKQEKEQNDNGNRWLFKVSREYKWTDLKKDSTLSKDIEIDKLVYSLNENRTGVIWYQNIPDEIRESIEKLINLYSKMDSINEELRTCENELWITKGRTQKGCFITGSWREFCDNRDKIRSTTKEEMEKDLKNSRIVPRRISQCFTEYFDGLQVVETHPMHKFGARYNSYLANVPGFDGEMAHEKNVEIDGRPGEQQIRDILIGKKEVKRELLLLMGLVHKVICGKSTHMSYLKGHVLHYSRYSMDFRNNVYEQFVENAYEEMHEIPDKNGRLQRLKELSFEVEKYYLLTRNNQSGIAIFSYVMGGNEVEM